MTWRAVCAHRDALISECYSDNQQHQWMKLTLSAVPSNAQYTPKFGV
jgi:hypothetical protein